MLIAAVEIHIGEDVLLLRYGCCFVGRHSLSVQKYAFYYCHIPLNLESSFLLHRDIFTYEK